MNKQNQNQNVSMETAEELLNQAKEIARATEEKHEEILTLIDKVIKFLNMKEGE